MKKTLSLILALAMALSLAACGGNDAPAETTGPAPAESSAPAETTAPAGPADTTLTVGVLTETDGFDPIVSTNFLGCNLVYETLVDIDPETSEAVGVLAESWEFRDDTHLYFKLYDNATFSNGEPVTAEDVYWSWYRNIENNSNNMNNLHFVDWDNWEFINDKEFVISFSEPFGPAVNYMTMCCFSIVDKSAMENATADDYWSAPVGSGPYAVVENVSGSYSSYKLRDTYWNADTMPEVTEVTVKNYSDAATMFIDYETGGLDIAFDVDVTDADRAASGSVANTTLEYISTNNVMSLAYPEYTEELNDVRVREALACAIDVEALTEIAFGSLGTVATSFIPSGVQYAVDFGAQKYDPERAKQLLAEAGYEEGELSMNLVIVGAPTNERLATTIQAYFAAVGVNLEVESCDLATAISHFMNSETDIVINSGSVVTMDTYEALQMTMQTSTNATIRISDEAYNQALLDGKVSSDPAVVKAAYEGAQQWLYENFRQIPIVEPVSANVYNSTKVASVNTMYDEAITVRYVDLVEVG